MCAVASFTLSYKSKERNCLSHGQVVLLSVFPDSMKGEKKKIKKKIIGDRLENVQHSDLFNLKLYVVKENISRFFFVFVFLNNMLLEIDSGNKFMTLLCTVYF